MIFHSFRVNEEPEGVPPSDEELLNLEINRYLSRTKYKVLDPFSSSNLYDDIWLFFAQQAHVVEESLESCIMFGLKLAVKSFVRAYPLRGVSKHRLIFYLPSWYIFVFF